MNPIELIGLANGRPTVRAESRLPNYILDVVLSYFTKFYSYIYSNCGALSQTILLITEAP